MKSTERKPGPYPYYGASGIVDYVDSFIFEGLHLLVAEDGENLRSRNTPVAFLADGQFWVNNHAHVLEGSALSDIRYLSYAVEQLDLSGYLTGSTQPKLTKAALDSVEITLPPLPEQQAIAEVLGALDEKIAANAALTTAAEALAVSEMSALRSRVPLDQLVTLSKAQLKPHEFAVGQVDHFSLPAFDTDKLPAREFGSEIKSAKFLLSAPAVLLSKLNPRFPRIWRADPKAATTALASTEFLVLSPVDTSPAMLWASLAQPAFSTELDTRAAGTSGSHQRVKPADALAIEVHDPRTASTGLRAVIDAALSAADLHREENRTLAATRDALLPQLMSGKLRVRDAETLAAAAGA